MAETTNNTHVITGKVRLSYANLFTPKAPEDGGEPKYSAAILVPKSDKSTLAKIKAAIDAVKADPKSIQLWGGKVPTDMKMPVRDGDDKADTNPEYAGCLFFNASSKRQPGLVDQQRAPITNDTELYSGCYARVSVNFYAFNKKGNRGIGVGLNNVQKWADGESLSGRKRAEDEFDDLPYEADDLLG